MSWKQPRRPSAGPQKADIGTFDEWHAAHHAGNHCPSVSFGTCRDLEWHHCFYTPAHTRCAQDGHDPRLCWYVGEYKPGATCRSLYERISNGELDTTPATGG